MSQALENFEGVRNFIWRSWTARTKSQNKLALVGESATLLGGKVYVCQGRTSEGNDHNHVFVLDYRKKEWYSRTTEVLLHTREHSASLVDGLIFIVGGVVSGESSASCAPIPVQVFDPVLWEWRLVQTVSAVEHSAGLNAHTANYVPSVHQIFLFGGMVRDYVVSGTLLVFDINSFSFTEPHTVGKSPSPRYHHSSCVARKKLYIYGGAAQVDWLFLGDLHVLSIENGQLRWSQLKSYLPRVNCSCTLVLGRIYLFGGGRLNGGEDEPLVVYEVSKDKWATVRNNRSAMSQSSSFTVSGRLRNMSRHHSIYMDGRIVVLGGRSGAGDYIPLETVNELRCVRNTAGMELNKRIMDII